MKYQYDLIKLICVVYIWIINKTILLKQAHFLLKIEEYFGKEINENQINNFKKLLITI